jgi:hypothetical protein
MGNKQWTFAYCPLLIRSMEAPSLVILKEEVRQFKGKKIIKTSGYADIDYRRLTGKTVKDFKTRGKHFLVALPDFTLRIKAGPSQIRRYSIRNFSRYSFGESPVSDLNNF